MKQKRTFLLLGVVVAVLSMAVAYAAIQNVDLSVATNVKLTADQADFDVAFDGTPTLTGTGADTSTVTITGDTTATIDVKGLSAYGDTLLITIDVNNMSQDYLAKILDSNVTITNDNTEYFDVKYISPTTNPGPEYEGAPASVILPEGGIQIGNNGISIYPFRLEISMKKTPISADETANISVSFIAEPILYSF